MKRWLLALSLPLAACGGDDGSQVLDGKKLGDPDAYFGLKPCTCLEYRTDGSTQKLGVAVESTVTLAHGPEAYGLRYRMGGQSMRLDYLAPGNPDLLVHFIEEPGRQQEPTRTWLLQDPLPLLRFPVEDQTKALLHTGEGSYREQEAGGGEARPFTLNLRADYAPVTVDYSVGGEPRSSEGRRVSYTITATPPDGGAPVEVWTEGARTFVPEVGFTELDLDIDGMGRRKWVLENVRELTREQEPGGVGCPYNDGETPPPADICGLEL